MIKRIVAGGILLLALNSPSLLAKELSRHVANGVQQAYQLQSHGKQAEAIARLIKLRTQRQYDTAYVQRMLGSLYWQQQQLSQSEHALQRAVDTHALTSTQHGETLRMLADIQLSQGQFSQAVKNYRALLSFNQHDNQMMLDKPTQQAIWLRLGQSYYQLGQWHSSLQATQRYFTLGGEHSVSALNLQLGGQLALKKWSNAIQTTTELKNIEPNNKLWWQQQFALYLQVNNHQQALASLKQYQRAGFSLTQEQFKLMAQLYALNKVPEKAAQVYAQHINIGAKRSADNEAIEANYWQQAREWQRALTVWQRASVNHKRYRWRYIELLQQQKQFQTALRELHKQPETQQRELALTTIYYHLNQLSHALKHAQKANQLHSDKQTIRWLTYLVERQQV